MEGSTSTIDAYLESGEKRTFAGALAWPGWCRSGRDEASALQALCDYGARYEKVARAAGLTFQAPAGSSAFTVVERLQGDGTTDFGAPGKAPSRDDEPLDAVELSRLRTLLRACWNAFDSTVNAAGGKELRKGPRGGGRELSEIVEHVLGSEARYLAMLGWKFEIGEGRSLVNEQDRLHQEILEALELAARGEAPAVGPRGGSRWTPRYFVRRTAWHVLDHAWEIEDRALM